jgi:tetratricopeptide (TPR) repeat protein
MLNDIFSNLNTKVFMIRYAIIAALCWSNIAIAKPSVTVTPSQQLVVRAQNAAAQNKTTEALDLYESAVAADPRNVAAYVGLGRSYEAIGMQGKALRYYRLALDINPNDLNALEAQTIGMIAKATPSKAQLSLDRLRKLCPKGCPSLTQADAAFTKAAQKTPEKTIPAKTIPAKNIPAENIPAENITATPTK